MDKLFTSESVSQGHPDKMADQISDFILDRIIEKDNRAHVACETFITKDLVILGGETKTKAVIDVEQAVRYILKKIGYDREDIGFNFKSCNIINVIGKQSEDIFNSIGKNKKQNAGDQGSVFGYAVNETKNFMPTPIVYAHEIMKKHADIRKQGGADWLYPDAKVQITYIYRNGKPFKIDSLVFSTHHSSIIDRKNIIEFSMEEIIKKTIPKKFINKNTKYYINQSGRFCVGGPTGDCGLTGRKIIVDTYGGASKHGGGAFSGKDPSKIDRSAAYMARYLAKNIVALGLSKKCEIQISYVIGKSDPVSLYVVTFNTSNLKDNDIALFIKKNFDLSPKGIIHFLDLLRPIYSDTSFHGHFGRNEKNFTCCKDQ